VFKEMENNQDIMEIFDKDCPDYNYKLILVGQERVGKTSITNRFVNEMFNEQEASSKTVQIQRKIVKIDKTTKWAQLHIWDTLG
jgi:GTPase SAR1 family protein